MTVTSAAGVDFRRELGAQLVVLARENSLAEIHAIQEAQAASRGAVPAALPLEVFVHGALCVAYSGQCLTSEALGGRSANRGECAQACRLPYDLYRRWPAGRPRRPPYLLSPQDLAGWRSCPISMRAGVASLKIEGRLKIARSTSPASRAFTAARWIKRMAGLTGEPAARSNRDRTLRTRDVVLARALHRLVPRHRQPGARPRPLRHQTRRLSRRGARGSVPRREPRRRVHLRRRSSPATASCSTPARPRTREQGGRVYQVDTQSGPKPSCASARATSISAASCRPPLRSGKPTIPRSIARCARRSPGDKIRFQRDDRRWRSTAGPARR
jgi:putative protease